MHNAKIPGFFYYSVLVTNWLKGPYEMTRSLKQGSLLAILNILFGIIVLVFSALMGLQLTGVQLPVDLSSGYGALHDWGFFLLSLGLGIAMLMHAFEATLRHLFNLIAVAGLIMSLISHLRHP